jgi:chaperonin GroEL (HSP60 family)
MLYENKQLDDIKRILTLYAENYEKRTGLTFNQLEINTLKAMLQEEFQKKKQAMFNDIFGTFTAKSLLDTLDMVNDKDFQLELMQSEKE